MNVSDLMKNYFNEPAKVRHLVEVSTAALPVEPVKKNTWEHLKNPDLIQKVFHFENSKQLVYFLEDVIQLQDIMSHHGKLLIDHLAIMIQINTKDLERITDLDVEWAAKVDEIYEDIKSVQ